MSPKEILLEAVRRYETGEAGWIQGNYAVNKLDEVVGPTDNTACKFCILGIVHNIAPENVHLIRNLLANWFTTHYMLSHILFNDTPGRTKEEVIAALWECADSL